MIRFLLRLAPALLIYSTAHAQAPPVVPEVPPSSKDIVVPAQDTSGRSAPPELNITVPDGLGGRKEVPNITDKPNQTGLTTTIPSRPSGEAAEPIIIILAGSLAFGFMAGYGVRSAVSHHRRTHRRRHDLDLPPRRFEPPLPRASHGGEKRRAVIMRSIDAGNVH
jgi:hypothetical protein